MHHFLPGDRVEIREILNERIWTVRPVTVIEDSEDQFVSYLATGTLIDYPVDVEHGESSRRLGCFALLLEACRLKCSPPYCLMGVSPPGT